MITEVERDLSNLSYTNKDFNAIYPELLDLAKKLSYKWDPSQSDESDPGVVLLKLAALMADKANYNIDKNILELYPLSVSQEQNARQIYSQCGYRMRYYRSAETDVQLVLQKEPELSDAQYAELHPDLTEEDLRTFRLQEPEYTRNYDIPRFTTISDIDNKIVYTMLDPVTLQSTGYRVTSRAIQGIPVHYSINGDPIITVAQLDYRNRLYLSDKDVAENGIFIHDAAGQDLGWKRVDNLSIEPVGSLCYEFDISADGRSLYIEFPSDVSTLIGEGIYITYIKTDGYRGNIGKKRLVQFFTDTTASCWITSTSVKQAVTLTASNVFITNELPAVSGKDPETIDEAYENYKKLKNTFYTLVSLRDYANFLRTEVDGIAPASNGYVCDRTNDIQSCYQILEHTDNREISHTVVMKSQTNEKIDELDAFDLRVYGLQFVHDPTTLESYNNSFNLFTTGDMSLFAVNVADLKCVQHDFVPFEKNRPLMFINRYPIKVKIIPQSKVETLEKAEIESKIVRALFETTNARRINFGDSIDYSYVFDIITNADYRIKAIILDDIEYETWAAYLDDNSEYKYVRIDSDYTPTESDPVDLIQTFRTDIFTKSVLAGVTPLFKPTTPFSLSVKQMNPEERSGIKSISTELKYTLKYNSTSRSFVGEPLEDNENLIFTAPNLEKENDYSSYVKYLSNISTSVSKDAIYKLNPNEFVAFFWKKSDGEDVPYTCRVYSEIDTKETSVNIITPNVSLKPQYGQGLYLKIDDNKYCNIDEVINYLSDFIPVNILDDKTNTRKRTKFIEFIVPSGEGSFSNVISTYMRQVEEGKNAYIQKNPDDKNVSLDVCIAALTNGVSFYKWDDNYYKFDSVSSISPVLSGTTSIQTKVPIQVTVAQQSGKIYWITNDIVDNKYYRLFNSGEDTRILKNGEYLLYTNASNTQLIMLSTGTKIERTVSTDAWITSSLVSYSDLISNGTAALDESWFSIPSNTTVVATEMEYYQYGKGYSVMLTPITTDEYKEGNTITFTNNSIEFKQDSKSSPEPLHSLEAFNIVTILSDASGTITTDLAPRNTASLAWLPETLLNLSMSPSRVQVFKKVKHAITTNNGLQDSSSLFPADSNYDEISVLADRDIYYVGGEHIDVQDYFSSNLQPLNLYIYNDTSDDFTKIFSVDGSQSDNLPIDVVFDAYDTEIQFKTSNKVVVNLNLYFLPGDYIVPIDLRNGDVKLNDVKIKSSSEDLATLTPLNKVTDSTKIYYYKISILKEASANITSQLQLTCTPPNDQSGRIVIKQPLKYEITAPAWWNSDSKNFEARIVSNLTALDSDSLFSYTYQPDVSVKIDNPLESKSFLDVNHIYNKFTICKWDSDGTDTSIAVTDKVR